MTILEKLMDEIYWKLYLDELESKTEYIDNALIKKVAKIK